MVSCDAAEIVRSDSADSLPAARPADGTPITSRMVHDVDRPASFAFFLMPEFSHLALACALEPLRIANHVAGGLIYRWTLVSTDGGPVCCSNGLETPVHHGIDRIRPADRLFLVSGINMQHHVTPQILGYLRRERALGTAIGAICSGAYVLARAGMLDGIETAIHWEYHDLMAETFPEVRLVPNIFVANARIITASGGAAAADLMLQLIRDQHGEALATAVADQMVYNAVREGSAMQRVSLRSLHGASSPHLIRAVEIMRRHCDDPLPPAEIAAQIGISTRQLERLFRKYLNASPRSYFMEMRLHRAQNLLMQTDKSITEIAMACGFGSTSHFSRAFRKQFGNHPAGRRAARG